jgi:hypothetical protein
MRLLASCRIHIRQVDGMKDPTSCRYGRRKLDVTGADGPGPSNGRPQDQRSR